MLSHVCLSRKNFHPTSRSRGMKTMSILNKPLPLLLIMTMTITSNNQNSITNKARKLATRHSISRSLRTSTLLFGWQAALSAQLATLYHSFLYHVSDLKHPNDAFFAHYVVHKAYATYLGLSTSDGTSLMAITSGSNFFGRICTGYVYTSRCIVNRPHSY